MNFSKVVFKNSTSAEGLLMPLKDKKLLAELLDHGQASIYKNEKLEDDSHLAVVNVSMDEENRTILHIYKYLCPINSISVILENATLSFISRGYIYIMKVSLKPLDNNHLQVLKVIDTKKHRLRDHFRVDVNIDFKVSLFNDSGEPEDTIPVVCDRTCNLSGGGFFFYALADLPEQRLLQISLDLGENDRIYVKGKIIRCRLLNERNPLFGIAVRFIDISGQEYESILNFLYSIQRKQLNKGTYRESKQRV